MKTIVISNQKGGVGKTTCAYNLADSLANLNYKTILIDLDHQGNSTYGLVPKETLFEYHSSELFFNAKMNIEEALHQTTNPYLWLLPADKELNAVDAYMPVKTNPEQVLFKQLTKICLLFDFCIIDCPTETKYLTKNAIYTSDFIVIPTQTGIDSVIGIAQLFDFIRNIPMDNPPPWKILINMYDARKKTGNSFAAEELEEFKKHNYLFKTKIRCDENFAAAKIFNQTILKFKPKSRGAEDIISLTHEILNEFGVPYEQT